MGEAEEELHSQDHGTHGTPLIWARVRSDCAWIVAREPLVLAIALPVLIISPSAAIPRWLEFITVLAMPIPWFARRVAWGAWTRGTPLDLTLLAFFVVHLTGALISVDPALSWIALKCAILKLVLFYAVVNHGRSARSLKLVAVLLLIAGLTAGTVGALGTRPISGRLLSLGASVPLGMTKIPVLNPEGFSKNIWGGTVGMVIPMAFALSLSGSLWRRSVTGLFALFLAVLCVLSQSRGALVGILLGIWTVVLLRSRWALIALPVAIAGAIVAVQRWGEAGIAEFFLSSEALGGWESRMEVWSRALYMIQDFPFTGIGLGTFSRVAPVMYPFFLISPDAVVPHSHQLFLQTAVDVGLPGLIAFLATLVLLIVVSRETFRLSKGTPWRYLAHGLFGGFVVYLVHGFFDYITFSTKSASIIWTMMGLMVALWLYLRSTETSVNGHVLGAVARVRDPVRGRAKQAHAGPASTVESI